MEDEDGESKIIDMWNILEEQQLKDSTLSNALRHSIDDVYTNVIEEEKQLIAYNSIVRKESSGKNTVAGPKLAFKGFKKRILAQAREVHTAASRNSAPESQQPTHPNARGGRDRRAERKRERKIAEYTQYLGLQPSARNRCAKCHAWSNCDPNLKQQSSCTCNSSMTPMPSTSESSATLSHASNYKRKVYLCSACKMYYENWNMFLHMREIHKRHICLFCLGMFGHAERLLHHLAKKHNVPEIPFATAGDFHNTFKGSCYLVCCDCEKVFSETDDFFSHYCSPTLTQEATDTGTSVCTICRQTGTHASTCNFALLSDTDRESYGAATPLTVADTTRADNASPATVPLPEKTNLGGKGLPRKGIKYNRNRHGGNGVQNSRPQKLNSLARKLDTKNRCNETQPDCDHDVQKEIANSLARDTVTETIMEVSRYTGGDSSDENDENDEQAVNKDVYSSRDRGLDEKSPIQNCQLDRSEPYDSVTETIMEVSRYTGEEDRIERREDSTCTPDTLASHHEKMDTEEEEETCDRSNIHPANLASSRAPSPVRWEAEEPADARSNPTCESGIESGCRSCSPRDARSPSPVNRSLFSPQHESHVSKEEEHFEDDEKVEVQKKEDKPNATAESQATFSAVASSDRSLVIKICNRNSQFSVATTTTASRESEESNADGSREKISNGADKERNLGDDQANELNDSDSDSDKLAVVDSNPEEDEEDGEEGDEAEEEAEEDVVHDDAGDGSQENQEGNGGNFGTSIDGFAETAPSGDVGEGFANSEVEGPQAEGAANDQARSQTIGDDGIALAGEDVPFIDLNVEGTLDSMELEELLKRCIEAASPFCVYCNHARYIAVNGKQLGLHMLAEHKFQPQHPAIIIHAEQFVARVKRSLEELESRHFNLNTYDSTNGTYDVPGVLIYECFHCRFHSTVHKELYLHNRKMHQKTILKCIMCKSLFYSYSELVCHLCPGVYSPNVNLRYRCCLCSTTSLPSTFRLMVHLRKRHHACDVCLESTGNQQRLSNHVWKHKLHHVCYKCGIAYRNKPDITKHLFWKHGTESVLCRKCLQKKWPHIYHFCIPPTAFVCEECSSSFSRAVALKVHKRLHSNDSPYSCDECTERFISRKLLAKHQAAHREPEPEDVYVNVTDVVNDPSSDKDERSEKDALTTTTTIDSAAATGLAVETASKSVKEAVKRVVDVYDLPPLNLSSESDTDSEEEKVATVEKPPEKEKIDEDVAEKKSEIVEETVAAAAVVAADDDVTALTNDIVEVERNEEEKKQEARIMDGIWDNFKTYAASLDVEESAKNVALKESVPETDAAYLRSIVLADHDYHVVYRDKEKSEEVATCKDNDGAEEQRHDVKPERTPSPSSPTRNADNDASKRKTKTPKKKKRSGSASSTSDSSTDSDTSSCSCGDNCSCSSSSSGSSSSSSSSSDSDSSASESSPRKQSSGRKDRSKKEREIARENKSQSAEPENKPEMTIENGSAVPEITIESPTPPLKLLLRESDLETEETETDEDFYDEHPQLLANKTEKRNQLQLLAAVASASAPTSLPAMEQPSTPLNNGVFDAEMTLPEMNVMDQQPQQPQQQKKKAKTKKRRKGERSRRSNATNATVESIKLNIPKAFYSQKNLGFASPVALHNSRSSTPNLMPAATCNDFHSVGGASVTMEMMQQQAPLVAAVATPVIGIPNTNVGGGSETENKRVSKRKRVPKRFYGDSSDDEPQEKQPAFSRWRKVEIAPSNPVFTPPPPTAITSPLSIPKPTVAPTKLTFGVKTVTAGVYNRQHAQAEQTAGQQQATPPEVAPIAAAPASATESEDPAGSSSDSSESEMEDTGGQPGPPGHNAAPITPAVNAPAAERPVKIYCYCQCPYDEVSEMIACDGEDCRIEWFHFECVGIMVPPKGKWYCPDCRKKHGIVQNSDDYCD
ncbi:uncharacterized protein MESR4 [Linepithema humile]|uniref:uncharacterized protein MESR4 n=1 Tax=Linepithema humile TaxID=83485 RepID=UPI00062329FB|nr:PREDICTED: uncharacterized protein LOC105680009 [Linepithema humile]